MLQRDNICVSMVMFLGCATLQIQISFDTRSLMERMEVYWCHEPINEYWLPKDLLVNIIWITIDADEQRLFYKKGLPWSGCGSAVLLCCPSLRFFDSLDDSKSMRANSVNFFPVRRQLTAIYTWRLLSLYVRRMQYLSSRRKTFCSLMLKMAGNTIFLATDVRYLSLGEVRMESLAPEFVGRFWNEIDGMNRMKVERWWWIDCDTDTGAKWRRY